jgi:hypothetical protein
MGEQAIVGLALGGMNHTAVWPRDARNFAGGGDKN